VQVDLLQEAPVLSHLVLKVAEPSAILEVMLEVFVEVGVWCPWVGIVVFSSSWVDVG
jgi:hypothetical protein